MTDRASESVYVLPSSVVCYPFNVLSNGLFHIRLLDGNTGRIERTFARVSAGTSVVFPDAVKSPTGDFVLFVRRLFVHTGLADLKE
ncbi:hypothetical protein V1477_009500 [Vespula maculifrons]|uniref:Uncharacterized protein n=1 Tax=Vespula maculifrons TaxID=7453 RepID=A0ABD2C9Z6_VESMC